MQPAFLHCAAMNVLTSEHLILSIFGINAVISGVVACNMCKVILWMAPPKDNTTNQLPTTTQRLPITQPPTTHLPTTHPPTTRHNTTNKWYSSHSHAKVNWLLYLYILALSPAAVHSPTQYIRTCTCIQYKYIEVHRDVSIHMQPLLLTHTLHTQWWLPWDYIP